MSHFWGVIQYFPSEENHWGDRLSRRRVLDSEGSVVRANAIAVVDPARGDYSMPFNAGIQDQAGSDGARSGETGHPA